MVPCLRWLQISKRKSKLSPPPDFFHHMLLFSPVHVFVASWQWETGMGMCKRIKHPNVKECTLPIPPLKIPSSNIKLSTIFPVGSGMLERFTIQWLKRAGSTPTSQHASLRRLAVKSPKFHCGVYMEIHNMDKWKHAPQKMSFHIHKTSTQDYTSPCLPRTSGKACQAPFFICDLIWQNRAYHLFWSIEKWRF